MQRAANQQGKPHGDHGRGGRRGHADVGLVLRPQPHRARLACGRRVVERCRRAHLSRLRTLRGQRSARGLHDRKLQRRRGRPLRHKCRRRAAPRHGARLPLGGARRRRRARRHRRERHRRRHHHLPLHRCTHHGVDDRWTTVRGRRRRWRARRDGRGARAARAERGRQLHRQLWRATRRHRRDRDGRRAECLARQDLPRHQSWHAAGERWVHLRRGGRLSRPAGRCDAHAHAECRARVHRRRGRRGERLRDPQRPAVRARKRRISSASRARSPATAAASSSAAPPPSSASSQARCAAASRYATPARTSWRAHSASSRALRSSGARRARRRAVSGSATATSRPLAPSSASAARTPTAAAACSSPLLGWSAARLRSTTPSSRAARRRWATAPQSAAATSGLRRAT